MGHFGPSAFCNSSCFVFMPATIIDSLLKLEVEFCSGLALKQREKLVDFFPNFSATLFLKKIYLIKFKKLLNFCI